MAWGKNHEVELAVAKKENELLQRQLDEKVAEIKDLRDSLRQAYNALAAKESPEAWRQAQDDKQPPVDPEALKRQQEEMKAYRYLIAENDRPLFKSADDMMEMFMKAVPLVAPESKSLHGDGES